MKGKWKRTLLIPSEWKINWYNFLQVILLSNKEDTDWS